LKKGKNGKKSEKIGPVKGIGCFGGEEPSKRGPSDWGRRRAGKRGRRNKAFPDRSLGTSFRGRRSKQKKQLGGKDGEKAAYHHPKKVIPPGSSCADGSASMH